MMLRIPKVRHSETKSRYSGAKSTKINTTYTANLRARQPPKGKVKTKNKQHLHWLIGIHIS